MAAENNELLNKKNILINDITLYLTNLNSTLSITEALGTKIDPVVFKKIDAIQTTVTVWKNIAFTLAQFKQLQIICANLKNYQNSTSNEIINCINVAYLFIKKSSLPTKQRNNSAQINPEKLLLYVVNFNHLSPIHQLNVKEAEILFNFLHYRTPFPPNFLFEEKINAFICANPNKNIFIKTIKMSLKNIITPPAVNKKNIYMLYAWIFLAHDKKEFCSISPKTAAIFSTLITNWKTTKYREAIEDIIVQNINDLKTDQKEEDDDDNSIEVLISVVDYHIENLLKKPSLVQNSLMACSKIISKNSKFQFNEENSPDKSNENEDNTCDFYVWLIIYIHYKKKPPLSAHEKESFTNLIEVDYFELAQNAQDGLTESIFLSIYTILLDSNLKSTILSELNKINPYDLNKKTSAQNTTYPQSFLIEQFSSILTQPAQPADETTPPTTPEEPPASLLSPGRNK